MITSDTVLPLCLVQSEHVKFICFQLLGLLNKLSVSGLYTCVFTPPCRVPTMATWGAVGGVGLVWVTDWRLILDYVPYINGKFKKDNWVTSCVKVSDRFCDCSTDESVFSDLCFLQPAVPYVETVPREGSVGNWAHNNRLSTIGAQMFVGDLVTSWYFLLINNKI